MSKDLAYSVSIHILAVPPQSSLFIQLLVERQEEKTGEKRED